MTFEETLAALHGMLGGEVEVSVGAAEGTPAIVGTWMGRLAAASELSTRRWPEAEEIFYFHLDQDPASGFFLHAEAFRGARWLGGKPDSSVVLEIRSGPLALVVERIAGTA